MSDLLWQLDPAFLEQYNASRESLKNCRVEDFEVNGCVCACAREYRHLNCVLCTSVARHSHPISSSLSTAQVKQILGTGSFGRVQLVKHRKTGKLYALKALSKSLVLKTKQVGIVGMPWRGFCD